MLLLCFVGTGRYDRAAITLRLSIRSDSEDCLCDEEVDDKA